MNLAFFCKHAPRKSAKLWGQRWTFARQSSHKADDLWNLRKGSEDLVGWFHTWKYRGWPIKTEPDLHDFAAYPHTEACKKEPWETHGFWPCLVSLAQSSPKTFLRVTFGWTGWVCSNKAPSKAKHTKTRFESMTSIVLHKQLDSYDQLCHRGFWASRQMLLTPIIFSVW